MARRWSRAQARVFRGLRLASAAALVLISLVIVLGAGGVALPFGGALWVVGVAASIIFAVLHWTGEMAARVVGTLGCLAALVAIPLYLLTPDPVWVRATLAVAGVMGVIAIVIELGIRRR